MTNVTLRMYYQTEEELLTRLNTIENKSELNYLIVFQCKILELSLPLNQFSNLLTLEFRKCFIRYLQDDIFRNLLQLDKINFEINQISIIPDHLFEKNTKLTTIIFKYNSLQDFHAKVFLPLKDLSYLDLRHNEITSVPSYCLNSPNLTVLRLSNNKITVISYTAFYGIRNLRYLELHNNQIWKLKSDFLAKSIELRYLSLNNNSLKELPPFVFLPVRKLEILLLSNIRLMELTRHVFYNNCNLTSLDLSNNEIHSIRKDMFKNVPLLKYLCISVRLHFEFQSIANLKYLGYFELVFTGPPITALSSDLSYAFRNKKQLETIRLFFYNFDNSQNNDFFYSLPDLKFLQIECLNPDAKNGDFNLERQFNQVPQLETLILKRLNCFTVVKTEDTYEFNLVHLKHLDLTGLKNTTITDTFYFFISLQMLNLSYSEISVISDNAFISLSNLKFLDLHCSKLKQITAKIFEFNYELQIINLAHNCLETIEDYSFKNLKKLKELHLKDNPLQNLNNDKPFYGLKGKTTIYFSC